MSDMPSASYSTPRESDTHTHTHRMISVGPEGFKLINIAQVLDQRSMRGSNTYQKLLI